MHASRLLAVGVLALVTGPPALAYKPDRGFFEVKTYQVAVSGDDYTIECEIGPSEGWGRDPSATAHEFPKALDRPVIRFYRRGRLLRTVTLREVVTDPGRVRVQPWMFLGPPEELRPVWWWEASGPALFSPTFEVTALDGTRTVFDIRTGETVRQELLPSWRRPFAVRVIAAVAGVVLLVGGAVLFRRWVRRRRARGNDEPGPAGAGSGA